MNEAQNSAELCKTIMEINNLRENRLRFLSYLLLKIFEQQVNEENEGFHRAASFALSAKVQIPAQTV